MASFTQVSRNNPLRPLYTYNFQTPRKSHTSDLINQQYSVGSTGHAAPNYALSCSQMFPNSSQPQLSPSAL